jgi:hypothetical protein
MWGQLVDRRQVKTAIPQHGQDDRMLPRRTGRRNTEIGLGLGEVQDLHAVGEHRGEGLAGIELSLLHLGDVGDDVGLETPDWPMSSVRRWSNSSSGIDWSGRLSSMTGI